MPSLDRKPCTTRTQSRPLALISFFWGWVSLNTPLKPKRVLRPRKDCECSLQWQGQRGITCWDSMCPLLSSSPGLKGRMSSSACLRDVGVWEVKSCTSASKRHYTASGPPMNQAPCGTAGAVVLAQILPDRTQDCSPSPRGLQLSSFEVLKPNTLNLNQPQGFKPPPRSSPVHCRPL